MSIVNIYSYILLEGGEHMSVAIQDFLICLEMIPAAIAHSYVDNYLSFQELNKTEMHREKADRFIFLFLE